MNKADNLDELYTWLAWQCIHSSMSAPRDMLCREILNANVCLTDITKNIVTIEGLETNMAYAKMELAWYMSGSNKIADMGEYAKIWQKYSDDGICVNSAYGQYMFNEKTRYSNVKQWDWCIRKLREDPDTRQAVININHPLHKDTPTKDFPCTIALQFLLRKNKLHMITTMRSNDLYRGFRNDVYCFTELQKVMAINLDVDFGSYCHNVGSLHIYEADMPKFSKIDLLSQKYQ